MIGTSSPYVFAAYVASSRCSSSSMSIRPSPADWRRSSATWCRSASEIRSRDRSSRGTPPGPLPPWAQYREGYSTFVATEPDFRYSDLLPIGPDETPYRLITTEGVSTFEADGRTFLRVAPEAIRLLTAEAMHDIAHFLRPAHLAQLRRIIDDPESSGNDRFVALDLLKNVNISAGGVLPMCQDTGTAIVMGKKSEGVLTGADDGEAISRGVYDAYTKLNLRYSQLAPITTWEEKNTGTNLPAQIELYSTPSTRKARVQVPVHGQGRRLGEQVLPLPGDQGRPEPEADAGVPRREDPLARARPPARRTTSRW